MPKTTEKEIAHTQLNCSPLTPKPPHVRPLCWRCSTQRPIFTRAAPYERSLSVIMTRGGVTADFRSFLMSRCAARLSLRRWTKTSRTKPILIDRAPQPVRLASNRDDDLIHMPFVAASRRALADLIGERLAELLPPLAHGLVRHANPARRQHFLDHAKAQGKPEIEPNGIADD